MIRLYRESDDEPGKGRERPFPAEIRFTRRRRTGGDPLPATEAFLIDPISGRVLARVYNIGIEAGG